MSDTFAELGGEVLFEGAISKGDTDMTAILTEVAAAGPDILYFPLFEPEANFIAAQLATTPGSGRHRDDDGGWQPGRRIHQ